MKKIIIVNVAPIELRTTATMHKYAAVLKKCANSYVTNDIPVLIPITPAAKEVCAMIMHIILSVLSNDTFFRIRANRHTVEIADRIQAIVMNARAAVILGKIGETEM